MKDINILIPMAGLGARMMSDIPKPLIKINNKYIIEIVIDNLLNDKPKNLDINFIFCILKEHIVNYDINNILKSILRKYGLKHKFVVVDKITKGAACTCLLSRKYINNEKPLIITNCDQDILDFDINNLMKFVSIFNPDGVLGIILASNVRHSYANLNNDFKIINVKEKQVISNYALNGIHYYKCGSDFVDSAEDMIKNKDMFNNEFYVSKTYNYLINKGKLILPFFYNLHFPIGKKEDLEIYIKALENI